MFNDRFSPYRLTALFVLAVLVLFGPGAGHLATRALGAQGGTSTGRRKSSVGSRMGYTWAKHSRIPCRLVVNGGDPMPGPTPLPIRLTLRQRQLLDLLVRRQSSSQQLLRRLQIVCLAADGANNDQIARQLPCHRETACTWRARWHAGAACLEAAEAEGASETQLLRLIEAILADEPRPGAPVTFSAESLVQIMALACEDPQATGRPVSHWTPRELADEAIHRGIVESISPRSVGRFLKGGRPQAPSEPLLAQRPAKGPRGVSSAGGGDL